MCTLTPIFFEMLQCETNAMSATQHQVTGGARRTSQLALPSRGPPHMVRVQSLPP